MGRPRTNPFVSPLGCSGAAVFVAALAGVLLLLGAAPFNPGPLSAARSAGTRAGGFTSHAEFEAQCEQCHTPFRAPHAERCEACHTTIAAERAAGAGLHGRLPGTERCATCHTEHKGRTARITSLDLAGFDHAGITGFSLARHTLDYDKTPLECAGCHRESRFTRAALDCADCHTAAEPAFMAEHRELFGDDCLACHDGVDSAADFDHAQVFPLDGAHAAAACTACHAGRRFAGTPHECAACHSQDTPANHYPGQCGQCHNTTDWEQATFDHSGFTDCAACHARHAPADHYPGQCSQCHNTIDWEQATFNHSGFTDCAACHARHAPADHYPGQCGSCHNTEDWDEVNFSHAGFDDCIACHLRDVPDDDHPPVSQCSECHTTNDWDDD